MSDNTSGGRGKGIKAVRRCFDVIEMIKDEGPVRAGTIADRLDCSQSTVHYHLKTLQNCGYLVRDERGYRLGIRFLHLGGHSLVSRGLYRAMDNEVPALAIDVGESVQVAVEEYGIGYYVEHVSGIDASPSTRHVGTEMYLHSTAAGKAILSALSPGRVNDIIEQQGLKQFTENTVSDRSALIDELQRVQERGIAFEVREYRPDESGVAVPLQRGDDVVGAIELTLPPTRIPDPRRTSKEERFPSELVDRVREAARSIEDRLQN